jgi:hypothetical protein
MELFTLRDNYGTIYAENATEAYCNKVIEDFAKASNLGLYYRTNLLDDGSHWIDYGSHTHFFILVSERSQDEGL